ncbi:pyruvate ferredoxin oxidoreductase [bacterium]|nr:pyruvate ferredoxin oxidoreductase [bacterium]
MSVRLEKVALTGNQALAHAVRMAKTQVVAAYPITPQTSVVETIAEFCAKGEMDAHFIQTESEHSSMSACIGASMTGARTFTATSSQGLALMHEMLHWAVGARTPIVLGEVNRALAAPWTILSDQSDSMAQRDTGWMQFYCGNNQEVFDTALLAFKLCEAVLLPAMVVLDAFVLSHSVEGVLLPHQELVNQYLPLRETLAKLDPDEPHAFGGMMFPDVFMEQRFKIEESMDIARGVIMECATEWDALTGRLLKPLHCYHTEDAEYIVMCLGTAFGAAMQAVDQLRSKGIKAGAIRMWQYRPFPTQELIDTIPDTSSLAVVDRAVSFGCGGPVGTETKAIFSGNNQVKVYNYIAGLGGREIRSSSFEKVFSGMMENTASQNKINWLEVRQ